MLPARPALAAVIVVALAGCATNGSASPTSPGASDLARSPTPATPAPSASGTSSPAPATPAASTPPPRGDIRLELDVIVEGLASPVGVAAPDDGSHRLFVIEQAGTVRVVEGTRLDPAPVLDLRDRIRSGGERGLLGITLHPDFPDDPRLFLDYTDLDGDTVVSEFRLSDDGTQGDPATERVLLRIDQPYANHNGGAVAFGPDGYLYIAMGDGGASGDPEDRAERRDELLGKILRIDIQPGGEAPYTIPDSNPFLDDPAARPEIAHVGLRNPWRIAFDRGTGDLWIGDVGQNRFEELDVARAGQLGLDFGWDRMEGRHCFEPRTGCDPTGLTLPVAEYGREFGCSVVGGPVYRGAALSALVGMALFADVCSGLLFGVEASGPDEQEPQLLLETGRPIASLGEDPDGEILAIDLGGGALLRLAAAG